MSTENEPDRRAVLTNERPINAGTAVLLLVIAAIIAVMGWYFLGRMGLLERLAATNTAVTDELRKDFKEKNEKQGQAISGITESMSDFSARLRSFESELTEARGQFELLDQLATERLSEHALSRARVVQVRSLADKVSTQLDRFEEQLQNWGQRVTALTTDDSGKRLALSANRLSLIDDLLTQDRLTESGISDIRQQLQELRIPIDAAAKRENAVVTIPDSNVSALEGLLQAAMNAQQTLADDSGRLDSLLRQSAEEVVPTDAPTLANALTQYRERRFDALNDEIRKRLNSARAAAVEKIATATEEAERAREAAEIARIRLVAEAQREADEIRGRIEAQRIRDDADGEQRAEQERQQATQKLTEKRQRLRDYQAALPEMKRLLAAFLSGGHRQLNGTRWQFSDRATPLSYAGIQATGALENAESGYEAFLWLAGGSDNDRPNGPFPNYIGGNITMNFPALVAPIRRAQVLIEQYGDLLVEDGLLSP
ncbi:MAG: hypothetical protein ACYTGL_31145 [Planctomycetota bacterium]